MNCCGMGQVRVADEPARVLGTDMGNERWGGLDL